MARTKSGGWLKADALKTAAVGEQYAVLVGDDRVGVELWWHDVRKKYVVTYKRAPKAGLTVGREWHFTEHQLTMARKKFAACVEECKARVNTLT